MSEGSGRIARRAGIVGGFTLVSRVLGYTRDAVLAHAFGAGAAFDAFVVAQTIPSVFRRLVAEGTLMIAYVPLLAQREEEAGLEGMRAFASAVLGALFPVPLGLTALGMWLPEPLVEAFASGFDAERQRLAVRLTPVMMPFLAFVSLVAVAAGSLNARGVFGPPAAAPVLLNLAIIGCTLGMASRFEDPIVAAAWGVCVGGFAQLILQLPWLQRTSMLVAPRWRPRDPTLRTLLVRMGPAVFGVGIYQLNLVVIRQIASYLPQGQLSCYFFATRLEEFALGVFAVSISIAALPTLSQHAARRDLGAFRSTLMGALTTTNFITIPAMVGLFTLSGPVVSVLFQHGAFGAEDARLTATLVRILSLVLVPIGLVRVVVPAYYAVGDTRLPVWAAVGSLFTTCTLGVALRPSLEIVGLTLATAAASVLQLVILGAFFGRRVLVALGTPDASGEPEPALVKLSLHGLRCAAAIAPWGAFAAWVSTEMDWYSGQTSLLVRVGALVGVIAMCGVGYGLTANLLGVPEVRRLLGAIRRRV